MDSLRQEINLANQLTERVSFLSHLLKCIERKPTTENNILQPKEPQEVIEHLWEQVHALRQSNEEMEVVANHLQSVIGN